ncbi:MAG: hypothetical protein DRN03_04605 [Thermoplasmata archaeon]|nr:MAG: hypothetical protein DRN03_04605 [Thermoplasmata archaeon]
MEIYLARRPMDAWRIADEHKRKHSKPVKITILQVRDEKLAEELESALKARAIEKRCPNCNNQLWLISEDCFFCPRCRLYYIPSQDAIYYRLGDVIKQRTPAGPVDEVIEGFDDLLRKNCGFRGLNPVQERALREIIRKIEDGHTRGIIALPTGTGKTVLAACLLRWILARSEELRGACILFLAPRLVILKQVATIMDMAGICATGFHKVFRDLPITLCPLTEDVYPYEKGEELLSLLKFNRPHSLCVIAITPQLLWAIHKDSKKWRRLLRNMSRVKVIIMDDVHHTYNGEASQDVVREVIDNVEYVIGLSATPTNEAVANVGGLLTCRPIEEAMRLGVLVKGIKFCVYDTEVEKRGIRKPFDEWKVCIRRRARQYAEKIIKTIDEIRKSTDRDRVPKTAVACPNIKEANILYEILREKLGEENVHIAHYKSQEIGERDPAEIISRFRKRKGGVLISVSMIDIGFDDRDLEVLVLARPIRNPISYVQLVGRVLRTPSEETRAWNVKSRLGYCVVVDLTSSLYRLVGENNLQGFFELSESIMKGLEKAKKFEDDLRGDKRKDREIPEVDANVRVTHIKTQLVRPKPILCPNCRRYVYPEYRDVEKVCPECGFVFSPRPRY